MRHGRGGKTTYLFHLPASFLMPIHTRHCSTTSMGTTTSKLGNLLVMASIAKALSKPGGIKSMEKDLYSVPLSQDLVLQLLHHNSLDVGKKLEFFHWCSLRPNYKHSVDAYCQIFRTICKYPHQYHDDIFHLLAPMKRDGVVLDSLTFKLILDAFIKSGKFDSALEIFDYLEKDLSSAGCLSTDIYSSVLVALVRKDQISLALSIFLKLLESSSNSNGVIAIPDAIACNEMLVGLKKADMKEEFE